MKSVLAGFIGTYTSRYSDLRGYWVHGQLPFETSEYEVDLLGKPTDGDTPEEAARRLAIRGFKEQLAKHGLEVASVRSAILKILRQPEIVEGWHGDHRSAGHLVEFAATAMMESGRRYECKRKIFVAPHDPIKERRRLPADWGI